MSYKEKFSFFERNAEAKKMLEKYPNRIPVIVEVAKNCGLKPLSKQKFLVPNELTMGQFIYVIRKRIPDFKPNQALFLFCDNVLVPTSITIESIYDEHKSDDDFLYCTVALENTFG